MTEDRYSLYRLCECPECGGRGQMMSTYSQRADGSYHREDRMRPVRCSECRGEGRIRQEVASCATAEAVGVALVTCAREGEWAECAFGLLDRTPDCEECEGNGFKMYAGQPDACHTCNGAGVKRTGDWLVLPWMPSARNIRDAARTLARSKKRAGSS